jgi:hypothetical protein
MRKTYALILFSFLIFSTLMVLVSANFLDDLNSALQGTLNESTKQNLSKILLTALVALLTYEIVGFLPFIGNEGIKWGVSIIVAILSFLYISPGDILAIVTVYGALGIALTSVLPLVIIMFFSLRFEETMAEKGSNKKVYAQLFDTLIFIIFGIYQIYMIISPLPGTSGLRYLYLITAVIMFIWAIQLKKITIKFVKERKRRSEGEGVSGAHKERLEAERAILINNIHMNYEYSLDYGHSIKRLYRINKQLGYKKDAGVEGIPEIPPIREK